MLSQSRISFSSSVAWAQQDKSQVDFAGSEERQDTKEKQAQHVKMNCSQKLQ